MVTGASATTISAAAVCFLPRGTGVAITNAVSLRPGDVFFGQISGGPAHARRGPLGQYTVCEHMTKTCFFLRSRIIHIGLEKKRQYVR